MEVPLYCTYHCTVPYYNTETKATQVLSLSSSRVRLVSSRGTWQSTTNVQDILHPFLLAPTQIVKMLLMLMLVFSVSWLPYHAYFVATYFSPEIRRFRYIQHIFLAFYWLAMSHAMVYPVVYYLMNPT